MADALSVAVEILGAIGAAACTAASVVWTVARKVEALHSEIRDINKRLDGHEKRHDKHEEEDNEFAKGIGQWMLTAMKEIGQLQGVRPRSTWNEPTLPGIGHGGRDPE